MNTKTIQGTTAGKNLGQVMIDGHSYPADPNSDEFTDLLMDCFQRGRDVAAARQRQVMMHKLEKSASDVAAAAWAGRLMKRRAEKKPKLKVEHA